MKAIGKNIVVLPVKETETKTKGGLLLAEAHREDIRYRMAKVVTIGTDVVGVKDNDTSWFWYRNKKRKTYSNKRSRRSGRIIKQKLWDTNIHQQMQS
jgi:hypothetical protein